MGCKLWTLEILYYAIGMQHLSMVCYSRRFLVEVTQLGHRPKINGLSFRLFLFNSAVSVSWDPHDTAWEEGFCYLKAYKEAKVTAGFFRNIKKMVIDLDNG